MKLFGNRGGGKKRPKAYDNAMSEDTRVIRPDRDETARKRTPEERARIDAMIERYQRKKRRRRLIVLSAVIILVAALFIIWKMVVRPPAIVEPTPTPTPEVSATPNPSPEPTASGISYTRKEGVYTFVVLGKDYEAGLTDTILVGSLDTVNETLNVVSIPRDTLVNVPRSYKKINGLYSHNKYDMDKAKAELKTLLGFTVDSYVIVDIEAFEKIVETIGGVWFDVPVDMDYDDPVQDFHVHLRKGYQYLNPQDALGVVRFRQNNEGSEFGPGYVGADIDRIATQQAFLKEVVKQCLQIGNATKVNEFAQIFKDYVLTDLSVGNLIWYGLECLKLESGDVHFMTLPAEYNDYALGAPCCVVKLDEWLDMINERLSPYEEEITADVLDVITRDENGNLYATSGTILG